MWYGSVLRTAACFFFVAQALVFQTVTIIVERMGDYVQPHAASIQAWLPAVWDNSQGQGMLRMQVR